MARFYFEFNDPIICAAIHAGHNIEPWLKKDILLSDDDLLREEDPATDFFTLLSKNRIIADTSRFQVDLNRKRENAIYQNPEDSWGLQIRTKELEKAEKERVLLFYDAFYKATTKHVAKLIAKFGKVFVYDIHSYNHMRGGIDAEPNAAVDNPDVILGTNNMPDKWLPLVDEIEEKLSGLYYFEHHLDVRRNVKYSGGNFSRWLHNTFPGEVCCIALEFKKIYMNEWTGLVDAHSQNKLREMLGETLPLIRHYLANH